MSELLRFALLDDRENLGMHACMQGGGDGSIVELC